jgi:hypothetical protein
MNQFEYCVSPDKFYLARKNFILCEYNNTQHKFNEFNSDKIIIIEKKLNDFVFENCIKYENISLNK